jgi:hypothetical protein
MRALEPIGGTAALDYGVAGWVSLLQVPRRERAVLLLVDGLGFDFGTTALITLQSRQELESLLNRAREMFLKLSAAVVITRNVSSALYSRGFIDSVALPAHCCRALRVLLLRG